MGVLVTSTSDSTTKNEPSNGSFTSSSLFSTRYDVFLSFFLLILARSNYDHYARECNLGILMKKQKQNKKQKNLSAVFLTK